MKMTVPSTASLYQQREQLLRLVEQHPERLDAWVRPYSLGPSNFLGRRGDY
jgi:hypothetical protein